jgi:hypothetical protein
MPAIERPKVIEGALPPLAFKSAIQTGNGAAQNIAHGLGRVPTFVMVVPIDLTPATVGAYAVVEGAHDATNCVVTVTTGKTYRVFAW